MKWSDLEAQGVRRCCAMYRDGTRCKRRASDKYEWSWCEMHGPIFAAHAKAAIAALASQKVKEDRE